MADYFVGDVQGCFKGLERLLLTVDFKPSVDTLWLTGDLIARGPDSLATLDYLYRHQDSVRTVLGNHDLHFLSVAQGLKPVNPKDQLEPLLASVNLPLYLDWLRSQPLIRTLPDDSGFLTHAGLAPHWQVETALSWGQILHDELSSSQYQSFLPLMYGNKPSLWTEAVTDEEKLTFSVSAFSRMRYCDRQGRLDFIHKCAPDELPSNGDLIPWFEFDPDRFNNTHWLFGHWASLMGWTNNPNIHALDTGYVWGNHMTLLHWQTNDCIRLPA